MAELVIHTKKIRENIKTLSEFFRKHNREWSLITKVFSGDPEFMERILTDDVLELIQSVGDSRLDNLKTLKSVRPDMRTILIRPPVRGEAEEVIKYADISLNTSYDTIISLNEAAKKAGIIHKVIVMIEMGELREGVKRDEVMDFYRSVFNLPNIDIIGIGSNLGCMYGIEPTEDKMLQLALYKEMISEKFNKELKYVSGGTSITLPKVIEGTVPSEVNHFRIGEAAFFGVSPLYNERFLDLHTDTFEMIANIIEVEEKKLAPDGKISEANIGETRDFEEGDRQRSSLKAILDVGLLDVDREGIEPQDAEVKFVGITSDMLVVDVGHDDPRLREQYSVGHQVKFASNYMAVARMLISKFIKKRYVD